MDKLVQAKLDTELKKRELQNKEKKGVNGENKSKKKILSALIAGVFIGCITGITAFSVIHPKTKSTQKTDSNKTPIRTIELERTGIEEAFDGIIGRAKKEVLWITTAPTDQRINERIQMARKTNPKLEVVVISGQEGRNVAKAIAKANNYDCFLMQENFGPINWVMVDSIWFFDATTRYAVIPQENPEKVKQIWDWANNVLGAQSILVNRAQ